MDEQDDLLPKAEDLAFEWVMDYEDAYPHIELNNAKRQWCEHRPPSF